MGSQQLPFPHLTLRGCHQHFAVGASNSCEPRDRPQGRTSSNPGASSTGSGRQASKNKFVAVRQNCSPVPFYSSLRLTLVGTVWSILRCTFGPDCCPSGMTSHSGVWEHLGHSQRQAWLRGLGGGVHPASRMPQLARGGTCWLSVCFSLANSGFQASSQPVLVLGRAFRSLDCVAQELETCDLFWR